MKYFNLTEGQNPGERSSRKGVLTHKLGGNKSRKVSTATSPKFRRTAEKNRKARPRKKVTHFFILFSKNALLSLICRLYENEPDPSIYISTNRGQTLHIFCKIRKKWEFFRPNISQTCQCFSGLRARY